MGFMTITRTVHVLNCDVCGESRDSFEGGDGDLIAKRILPAKWIGIYDKAICPSCIRGLSRYLSSGIDHEALKELLGSMEGQSRRGSA